MVNIREMNASDVDTVRRIAADTWRDTYTSFIPEEIQDKVLKEAYSSEEMENRFKSSLNLVAESNGIIRGYAFFSGDKNIFLESLYVHPDNQGQGIGKQLLLAGISRFQEPASISLTVYKGNPNLSFYEREGFRVIKENKGDFYGHPITFILMIRNLFS